MSGNVLSEMRGPQNYYQFMQKMSFKKIVINLLNNYLVYYIYIYILNLLNKIN